MIPEGRGGGLQGCRQYSTLNFGGMVGIVVCPLPMIANREAKHGKGIVREETASKGVKKVKGDHVLIAHS